MESTEELVIKTIMNNSHDTIYFKDKESRIIISSKAHANLWGVEDPLDVVGKSDFDFFPKSFAEDAYRDEKIIMETQIPIIGKIEKLIQLDGSIKWLSASKYPFYNFKGEIIGTWGTSRDITLLKNAEEELARVNVELEKANEKLRILSLRDSLSGLYNHRYFSKEINKTFKLYKRQSQKDKSKDFSLVLLDIDNFKKVNDNYGHLMGDYVIKQLAKIMTENVRCSDSCFRYGGDEFAILLLDTDNDKGVEIANKLRKTIESTLITYGKSKLTITISIGISSFSKAKGSEELVRIADENLYLSKKRGKNKVN